MLMQQHHNCRFPLLPQVYSGQSYQTLQWDPLTVGSQGEGLAMDQIFGIEYPDEDMMYLYGGVLGVFIPNGTPIPDDPDTSPRLLLREDKSRPGYCRVEVYDGCTLLSELADMKGELWPDTIGCCGAWGCTDSDGEDDVSWLSSSKLLQCLLSVHLHHPDKRINGPAGAMSREPPPERCTDADFVPTLVCSDPHPCMRLFIARLTRSAWPRPAAVRDLSKLPALVVMTGHKKSVRSDLEFRFSWSLHEMRLAEDMPKWVKQGYCAFKCAFKRIHAKQCSSIDKGGRSLVGSYHLKTTLLYLLEDKPPPSWSPESAFDIMIALAEKLNKYLQRPAWLPHYFDPSCNLLECVEEEDLQHARDVLKTILADPVTVLIQTPKDPKRLYYRWRDDVTSDDLLQSLKGLQEHAGRPEEYDHLHRLRHILERIDDYRNWFVDRDIWRTPWRHKFYRNDVISQKNLVPMIESLFLRPLQSLPNGVQRPATFQDIEPQRPSISSTPKQVWFYVCT